MSSRAERFMPRWGMVPLTVFLMNGVKLTGSITEVEDDGVVLTRDGNSQLILWHAIATFMPHNAPFAG